MEQIGVKHIENVAPRVVASTLISARTLFLQNVRRSIKTLSGKQTDIDQEAKGIRKEINTLADSLADKARSAPSKAEVKNGKNILQALIELSLKRTA